MEKKIKNQTREREGGGNESDVHILSALTVVWNCPQKLVVENMLDQCLGETESRAFVHSSAVTRDKLFQPSTENIGESRGNYHTPYRFPDLHAH